MTLRCSRVSLPTARAVRTMARDADVVDAHFALYAFVPVVLGIARRRRLIVHFHGPWADEAARTGSRSRIAARARRFIERTVYRRASIVVTLSRAFADLVVTRYGVDPDRVRVIPPGVDTVHFAPGDPTAARARLGLPDTSWLIVAARRLVPRAGVDVLVRAAVELARDPAGSAPVTVVIAGAGPESDKLQALATELAAPVRFLGEISDGALVDLYRAADVAVVPSRSLEGFGLVVLEALACGTPVLVSDVDGLTEAVAGFPPDVVVPPGDAGALAARLPGPRARRLAATPEPGEVSRARRALSVVGGRGCPGGAHEGPASGGVRRSHGLAIGWGDRDGPFDRGAATRSGGARAVARRRSDRR